MKAILLLLALLYVEVANAQQEPMLGDSNEPIEITADTLTVKRMNEIAVFSGNVEAVQGKTNLRSDVMTVYYRSKKNAEETQNTISKIDVDGNVFLTTPDETAQGDSGVYNVDKKEVILVGKVVLTQQDNVIKGNRLVYDMKSGKSQLFSEKMDGVGQKGGGRVKGLFVPENKE